MECREKAISASIRLVAGCKWQTAPQVRCVDDVVFAAEYWHNISSKADVLALMNVWRIYESNGYLEIGLEMIIIN